MREEGRMERPNVYRAAVAVLVWMATLQGSALWGREQLVRQEAPFPAVFGPPASEPVRYEVLRGDFHMHTPYSDGTVLPVDRVIEAWQYGYDVIAITDHRSFRAHEDARSMAATLGLLLIRGMETGIGGLEHLVAIDFSADYQSRNEHQWAETGEQAQVFYQDQWRHMAATGGYVLYAHPHVGLREPVLWGIRQGLLEGIEVYNGFVGAGWNTVQSHGTYWYPFAFDWAVENNLTIFANSDVHSTRGDEEQAVTLVLAKDRSVEGVMEALRARRTVACFNNMLCAHKWVLELLMANMVEVRVLEDGEERAFLCLQNRGPVEVTAEIAGMPVGLITLGMYQKVLIGLRRKPDAVMMTWKNLYIRPTENLTTTHTFAGATP